MLGPRLIQDGGNDLGSGRDILDRVDRCEEREAGWTVSDLPEARLGFGLK